MKGVGIQNLRPWSGRLVAPALAFALGALAWCWNAPAPSPALWEHLAVAAGLRPPAAPLPALWHLLVSNLFGQFGLVAGTALLRLAGACALGGIFLLARLVLGDLLPAVLRRRMEQAGWSRIVVLAIPCQCAFLFACSDPVWRSCAFLSPTALQLLLLLVAVRVFLRFLHTASTPCAYLACAIVGLLAADSPAGLAAGLVFGALSYWKALSSQDQTVNPLANPLVRVLTQRRMTICFLLSLCCGLALVTHFFVSRDGFAALGCNALTFPIRYLHGYWRIATTAAFPVGWFLGLVVAGGPLLFSALLLRTAVDDDRFLPYGHGLVFLLLGVFSFLQLSGFDVFWFWTWFRPPAVASDLLLACFVFLSTLSALYALSVFVVEVFFRNYRRIAGQRFEDAVEEPAGARAYESIRAISREVKIACLAEPLVLLLAVLPFLHRAVPREMADLVDAAVRQTAAEAGDAEVLFSDGAPGPAVEFAAAVQGRRLPVLSMLAGNSPREIHLRRRAARDPEDEATLALGAADALRTWVRSKPERATNIAVQIGFELWRHDRRPMPACAGLVARTAGFSPRAAAAGSRAAHDLADRVLRVHDRIDPESIPDPALVEAFTFVQWRLARMCRARADAFEAQGRVEEAMFESELADRLDERNAAFKRIQRSVDWISQQRGARLTPREGLELGLSRTDFALARTFAQQILQSDPNDTPANFAMGMSYFTQEQYARAEIYLKRCLETRPDEVAVLNNLAVAQSRLGRHAEAETNILRAVSLRPQMPELRRTLKDIREKRAAAEGPAAPRQPAAAVPRSVPARRR